MTTEFQHDCPHCLTRLAGFQVFGQWPSPRGGSFANVVAICRVCSKGLLLLSYDIPGSNHVNLSQYQVEYPGNRYEIVQTWPDKAGRIIQNVPDNVANFYNQANESLKAQRWDAAGAMYRKSLDVATKLVEPQFRSLTLFRRIERLVEDNLLTRAMGEWAHEIRLDGNDAVQDEEPETETDVIATQQFTEAFLIYVFSLPKLVEANRAKRDLNIAA